MIWRQRLRSPWAAAVLTSVVVAALVVGLTRPTESAWNQAGMLQTGVAATNALSMSYTVAGQTCSTAGAGPGACATEVVSGNPGRLGASTVSGTLTNTSAGAPNNATQSIQMSVCEPLAFNDALNPSNPLLSRGGIDRQVPDKWGTNMAARFNGTDDSATGMTPVPLAQMAAGSWTIGSWYRVDAGTTGTTLIGGARSAETTPNSTYGGSPTLRLRATGELRLEWITPANVREGYMFAAPGSRNPGWHLATVSVNRATNQMVMYLDGNPVGTIGAAPLMHAFSGVDFYWHIGWGDVSRSQHWSDAPFFVGDISGAYYAPVALSQAQIMTLYRTTSAASYQSTLQSQGAANIWMLGDSRTNRYTGNVPYVDGGSGDPCAFVSLGVTSNGSTLVPTTPFATLVAQSNGGANWSASLPAPAPGASATIVTTYGRQSPFDSDLANMELQYVYAHRIRLGTTNWATAVEWGTRMVIA